MRRLRWLALAALLLAATAVLLSLAEGKPAPPRRPQPRFPEWFGTEQYRRQAARATLSLPAPALQAPEPRVPIPGGETGRRDPFLVSLPVKQDGLVVVLEANALRHSRLGELFVACLEARKPGDLAEVQKETGVDPLKDIDRVAYLEDGAVLSGNFANVRWDRLGSTPQAHGDAGRIYRDGNMWLAAWGDQILVFSENEASARRAIDQLEGRVPVPASGLTEDMAYGEVYGIVPGAAARRLLGDDDRGIASKLAALASRIELHVDAMQDVAAVVRVSGSDQAGLQDLGKTIGAALAVARFKAQADRDTELADLLENAEVQPGAGTFSLQLAVPVARLEKWFEGCQGRAGSDPGAQAPAATSGP
jgi:hypothetical protein